MVFNIELIKYCNPNKINTFVMLITFLCLLLNFHIQNISARVVIPSFHRNVISTQPKRVFCFMSSTYQHTCNFCGNQFKSQHKESKYCNQKCYFNTKHRQEYTKCATCDNVIKKKHEGNNYCSQKCYRINDFKIRECIVCNIQFKIPISILNRKGIAGSFCSQKCVNSYRVGDKNPNWRGGTTYDKNKKHVELNILRPTIREKFKYTCQKCGNNSKGIKLDVHHIIPYRLTQDNSLNNLTLLCHSCHMKEAKNELKLYK